MLNKIKAKIGLSMHLGSNKHYAKNIKNTPKKIKHLMHSREEIIKNIDICMKEEGSPDLIKNSFKDFISNCKSEAELLDNVSDEIFTIEKRVLDDLKKVLEELSSIASKPEVTSEAKEDLELIRKLFSYIHNKIRTEKILTSDLKRDKNRLRDKSILPDVFLLKRMRVAGKKERKDVKKVSHVFNDLYKSLDEVNKGNFHSLKRARSDIEELKKDVEEELTLFLKIMEAVVVFTERLKDHNHEVYEKILDLKNGGFPKDVLEEIRVMEEGFLGYLKESERKEYFTSKVVNSYSRAA
jgi:hypothetical protein